MARHDEGLRNPELIAAIPQALAGNDKKLEDLLLRHGISPSGKPNLNLAAVLGVELAQVEGRLEQLLLKWVAEPCAADSPRVVLPVVAAHAFGACIRVERKVDLAWANLAELAADDRSLVRVGTLEALIALAVREGGADSLVTHALAWLEVEDREQRFGAAALAIEALGDPRVIVGITDTEAFLSYLSAAIQEIADAPRSAERSDGRRRALTSLAHTLGVIVTSVRAGERGVQWFEAECAKAKHPDVRLALSQAIVKLRGSAGAFLSDSLRQILEQSAKPLRDPTLVRPGTGRGKGSRRTR